MDVTLRVLPLRPPDTCGKRLSRVARPRWVQLPTSNPAPAPASAVTSS